MLASTRRALADTTPIPISNGRNVINRILPGGYLCNPPVSAIVSGTTESELQEEENNNFSRGEGEREREEAFRWMLLGG